MRLVHQIILIVDYDVEMSMSYCTHSKCSLLKNYYFPVFVFVIVVYVVVVGGGDDFHSLHNYWIETIVVICCY